MPGFCQPRQVVNFVNNLVIAEPVYYSINACSVFADNELSYNKQYVVAAAQVCSEESASTTFSRTVAKLAPRGLK